MFGFYNIHKPPGPTSHDMVAAVRRMLPRRTKVGHTGTLDPFASGVLVVCVGPATRLADRVQRLPKRYWAEVTLGAISTTDDPQGQITRSRVSTPPGDEAVRHAAAKFVGEIQQTPPVHSAVHVGGERAYKLARAGETPKLAPRSVRIDRIDVLDYAYPRLRLDVTCGSGTYIRALARDIGRVLTVGGYCSELARTGVGDFTLETAVSPEQLDVVADLLPPMLAVENLPRVTAGGETLRRVLSGNTITAPDDMSGTNEAAIVDDAGRLVALARVDADERLLHPFKVFIGTS